MSILGFRHNTKCDVGCGKEAECFNVGGKYYCEGCNHGAHIINRSAIRGLKAEEAGVRHRISKAVDLLCEISVDDEEDYEKFYQALRLLER